MKKLRAYQLLSGPIGLFGGERTLIWGKTVWSETDVGRNDLLPKNACGQVNKKVVRVYPLIGQFWQDMSTVERYLRKWEMLYGGQCKMGLTGLHLYGSWRSNVYRSLLGLSTFLRFKRVYEKHFMFCYYGPAVWLELFASTVCCFFSRISYLSFIFARFFFRLW